MSYLTLTKAQKERRMMYVSGELKAKPLAKNSRAQQKLVSQTTLKQSLSATELVFV
ncbi:hypothetical protein [Psychromonas sp. Urea-02u-13]|uniref:hypothetical protein n=1 Tax=Psychromonas sp. Urea-02u-13 TaxID=2058326 RepID=UPI0012FF4B3C|nr:hypothetical protein [Psychromonas sp. Urea-02u-13]